MIKKNSMLAKKFRPLLLLFPLLLAACDKPVEESSGLTDTQREALELRVEERWRARIAHDWEKAWEYTSPAYREVFPKHLYVKKFYNT